MQWTKSRDIYVPHDFKELPKGVQSIINIKCRNDFYKGGTAIIFPKESDHYQLQHILNVSHKMNFYLLSNNSKKRTFEIQLNKYTCDKELDLSIKLKQNIPFIVFTKNILFQENSKPKFFKYLELLHHAVRYCISGEDLVLNNVGFFTFF